MIKNDLRRAISLISCSNKLIPSLALESGRWGDVHICRRLFTCNIPLGSLKNSARQYTVFACVHVAIQFPGAQLAAKCNFCRTACVVYSTSKLFPVLRFAWFNKPLRCAGQISSACWLDSSQSRQRGARSSLNSRAASERAQSSERHKWTDGHDIKYPAITRWWHAHASFWVLALSFHYRYQDESVDSEHFWHLRDGSRRMYNMRKGVFVVLVITSVNKTFHSSFSQHNIIQYNISMGSLVFI